MGQFYNLLFEDEELSCEVFRSNRKTSAIQVTEEGEVRIRVPNMTTYTELKNFIEENRDWIYRTHEKTKKRQEEIEKQIFCNGMVLQLQETRLQIEVIPNDSFDKTTICIVGDRLQIMTSALSEQNIHEYVIFWLKKIGKSIFQARAQYYASQMQVEYKNITIKDQKTRWGSCSSKKNLNFNYKLLLMQPQLLDYVVVHELAHLQEMNHSEKFWDLVEGILPDYQERRKKLMECCL